MAMCEQDRFLIAVTIGATITLMEYKRREDWIYLMERYQPGYVDHWKRLHPDETLPVVPEDGVLPLVPRIIFYREAMFTGYSGTTVVSPVLLESMSIMTHKDHIKGALWQPSFLRKDDLLEDLSTIRKHEHHGVRALRYNAIVYCELTLTYCRRR
jgi:hypothetical protein